MAEEFKDLITHFGGRRARKEIAPVQNLPIEYDPDVLRVAQRHADQLKAIAELEQALNEWKERALVAEQLNNRLDAHIKSVERDFSRERDEARAQYKEDVNRLTGDRDHWKDLYSRVEERLKVAGKVIIETLNLKSEGKVAVVEEPDVAQMLFKPPDEEPHKE